VCNLETSRMIRPWPALGRSATEKNVYILNWRSTVEWFWMCVQQVSLNHQLLPKILHNKFVYVNQRDSSWDKGRM